MSLDTQLEVNPASYANRSWPGLIETYREYLPVTATTPVVTLHEGNTPLIPVPTIAAHIGRGVKVYII
jgi:threonine synthase